MTKRVRFNDRFYDPRYGIFEKGEVYDVPDDVVLPKRGVTLIDGKKEALEDGEKVQKPRKPTPTKAEQQRTPVKPVKGQK